MESGDDGRKFFKVFFPDLDGHHLEIPRAFVKHVKNLSLGPVSLIGMSGNKWNVEVAEVGGKLCFDSCWENFVKDQDLQAGEFLVFEYDGARRFSVLVLDDSGCEKESAFHACPPREASEVSEEGVNGGGTLVPLEQKTFEMTTKTVALDVPGKKRGKKPLGCPPPGKLSADVAKERIRAKRVLLSQRRAVGREEIESAQEKAFSFRSSDPFFTTVMSKAAVYTGYLLNIPHVFARTHLPKEGGNMKLIDPNGHLWKVTYICTYGYFFSGGWRRFSIGTHLEEHDVCIFELVKPRTMRVHIFRVVEELAPRILQSQKYVKAEQPANYQPDGKIRRASWLPMHAVCPAWDGHEKCKAGF